VTLCCYYLLSNSHKQDIRDGIYIKNSFKLVLKHEWTSLGLKNTKEAEMPKLMSYAEIEKVYGLRKNTTTKLAMKGEFVPAVKIGTKNYFKTADIEAWIEARVVNA
jgi:hypothetical protein